MFKLVTPEINSKYLNVRKPPDKPYQTQQTQQTQQINIRIEQEDYSGESLRSDEQIPNPNELNTSPRADYMPPEGETGFLEVPPGTLLINPIPADYSTRTNDYMEYLRMPNLMAQFPGFAEEGDLGGITDNYLNELTELLRAPGGGRILTGAGNTPVTGPNTGDRR
ncbi:uncharacterized protein DFL_001570 [Arthrobotrys flagrans]|uniref:Uncharacterized protein n=1 Tax=Arthrobotrys flagrans TaxID=97331 RepID=A0A437A800_ARTFL|nr:hypothetical protein DFL_001570 [Arthrobotrys flagrans]